MTEEFLLRHPNPLQWLQLPSLLFLGFHPQVITGVTYVTVILFGLSLFLNGAKRALLHRLCYRSDSPKKRLRWSSVVR